MKTYTILDASGQKVNVEAATVDTDGNVLTLKDDQGQIVGMFRAFTSFYVAQ